MKFLIGYNQHRNIVILVRHVVVGVALLGLVMVFFAGSAGAQGGTLQNPTSYGNFPSLICGIFNFLKVIAQPLGIIFIVIAGIKFVTARGNEQKLTEAKGAILWAVIGFFVLFLGGDLVNIVADITDLTSGANACP